MLRKFGTAVGACTLIGSLASVGTAGASTAHSGKAQYVDGGTFSLAISSDPGDIDPYQSTEGTARQIYAFGYDTLLARSASGQPLPELAQSWTATPRKVTFTLRRGITCDDGSTLSATDVAKDLAYIKNPKTISPWLHFALPINYAVSADDASRTVTIRTVQNFGLLLQGAGELPIVCPQGLYNPDGIQHKFDGTGPYQITSYSTGVSYSMQVRPGYHWGPKGASTSAPGTPKNVNIQFVSSETTAANELLSGQLNAAQITGPDRNRLGSLQHVNVPVIVGELNFNERSNRITADPAVRKALAEAINYKNVAKVGTAGKGSVANNLAVEQPALCPGTTTDALPHRSLKAAKALLSADGWKVGHGGIRQKDGKALKINLIYQVGAPQTESAVELLSQEWAPLGVQTVINGYTETEWTQILTVTSNYDIFYSGINLEFPFQYTDFFGGPIPTKGGDNFGDLRNGQFLKLSGQALGTLGTAGCNLWNNAQRALMSRVDVVPISTGDRPFYMYHATLQTSGLFAVPTSIRLLAS